MVIVGILSDTHGILEHAVKSAFKDAGHILHAGDVVDAVSQKRLSLTSLLSSLREIAPTTAVRGNTDDKYAAGHGLPATAVLELAGVRFHMHHGDSMSDEDAIEQLRPASGWRKSGDVIISGHSHKAKLYRHVGTGVVFLNPGSCGPKRFNLPREFAVLECDGAGQISIRRFELTADLNQEIRALARPWPIEDHAGDGPIEDPAGDDPWRIKKRTLPSASAKTEGDSDDLAAGPSSLRQRRDRSPDFPATSGAAAPSSSRDMSDEIAVGTVRALFLKPQRGSPMQPVTSLTLVAREGIKGDVHQSQLTPRQCLVQSSQPGVVPGAFRENVLIDFAPGQWPPKSGSVLRLGGADAALRITFACEACGKGAAYAGMKLEQLKFRGWEAAAPRGMLATVLASGRVAVGDEVRMRPGQYAALSDTHSDRVKAVLARVPAGRVTSYTQLHLLAGAPTDYSSRGFPGLLRKALADGSPAVHRVLDSQWRAPRNGVGTLHYPEQPGLLAAEGVALDAVTGKVLGARESVEWAPAHEELFES
jgi:putative phosphoesterase